MTFTHALATNNYGPAKWIVATSAANGTHTTLASAMASASAGDTIFLRDSVTENVTITPGVNITAWSGGSLNTPSITGTLTMTGAGTSTISGIELITNSAPFLTVSGSAASIVNLNNCYLNASNNTGISFSSSSASSQININNCKGDLGTTGIKLFGHTSAGTLLFLYSRFTNSGGSTTASTITAGVVATLWSNFSAPITSSSTATTNFYQSIFDTAAGNATSLIIGGSGTNAIEICQIFSGTASAVSIGATGNIFSSFISSTNTDAITGAGTINYSNISFANGGSVLINTTTQNGGVCMGGVFQAPSAGFIGEQISSRASPSISSGVAANVTSISLTPGIWDISATGQVQPSVSATALNLGISLNSASFTGVDFGNNGLQFSSAATAILSMSLPAYRVIVTTTTTYYLVISATFTVNCVGNGRISATRVG